MIFVISGVSGCGKTTLIEKIMSRDSNLVFSVSHTTRPPRPSEQPGVHYYFVSEVKFKEMLRKNQFVEWAKVHGYYYGTSRNELRRQGKKLDIILDIDVQGARQIKKILSEAVFIFVMPPGAEEMKKRLLARGEDSPAIIERRLRAARSEINEYAKFDYVVVNDDLPRAIMELEAIITASRLKTNVLRSSLRPILRSFKIRR